MGLPTMQPAAGAAGAMPWGAMIQAGAQVADTAIQSALGGNNPSGAGAFDMRSYMDTSGWTVATGHARASASDTGSRKYEAGMTQGQPTQPVGGTPLAATSMLTSGAGMSPLLMVAAGAALLALVLKKRKG